MIRDDREIRGGPGDLAVPDEQGVVQVVWCEINPELIYIHRNFPTSLSCLPDAREFPMTRAVSALYNIHT